VKLFSTIEPSAFGLRSCRVEGNRQQMTDSSGSRSADGGLSASTAARSGSVRRRISGARSVLLFASVVLLGACGGGGEDQAAQQVNPPPPPPGTNQAPTISGTPASSVMQSSPYSFQPAANDANGDTLTFSIAGKPSWASFDTTNGKLNGTPTGGDVGNYQNIRISVSDGQVTVGLAAFSVSVVATATGAATLNWTPPTTHTDGSALTDLAGYRIYWGTSQNNYPNSKTLNGAGSPSSAVIDQLTPATYYFVVTAFDAALNESAYSNVATKTVM
jgi:hypothetical protein